MNFAFRAGVWARRELHCLRYTARPSSSLASYYFVLFMILTCVIVSIVLIVSSFSSNADEIVLTRPLRDVLSYAIVVDAGSSGSRGHLFTWPPHSGNPHHLLDLQPMTDLLGKPLLKAITPGLSSLRDRPETALEYLRPILDFASSHIPVGKHKDTPIYVLATAGMRLLNVSVQEAILGSLTAGIRQNYQFIVGPNSVQVISGREEGIFQWIAANYALNRFREPLDSSHMTRVVTSEGQQVKRQATVGVIDMGGASMQIAVEITTERQLQTLRDSVTRIDLGCLNFSDEHTYNIYVNTFLGYGANEMFRRHQRLLVSNVSDVNVPIYDDCLVPGYQEKLPVPPSLCQSRSPLPIQPNTTGTLDPFRRPVSDSNTGSGTLEPVKHVSDINTEGVPARFMRRPVNDSITASATSDPVSDGSTRGVPAKFVGSPIQYSSTVGVPAKLVRRSVNDSSSEKCEVTVIGTGEWSRCESSLIHQIRAERTTRVCNGTSEHASVHRESECQTLVLRRPPQSVRFAELIGFSEFWYSTQDVLRLGGQYSYTGLREKASTYCSTRWTVLKRRYFRTAIGDSHKFARQCFKSAYIAAALHEGLGIPRDFAALTTSSNVLAGRPASWPIGALLYKLRFLPLSAVKQEVPAPRWSAPGASLRLFEEFSLHVLLGCFLVVGTFTLLFAARLWRMRRGRSRAPSIGQCRQQSEDLQRLLSVVSYR